MFDPPTHDRREHKKNISGSAKRSPKVLGGPKKKLNSACSREIQTYRPTRVGAQVGDQFGFPRLSQSKTKRSILQTTIVNSHNQGSSELGGDRSSSHFHNSHRSFHAQVYRDRAAIIDQAIDTIPRTTKQMFDTLRKPFLISDDHAFHICNHEIIR